MGRHSVAVAIIAMGIAPAFAQETIAGRPTADWFKDLDDRQTLVREEAIEALALGKVKSALPKLEKLLDDPQRCVRFKAAMALWKIEGRTEPAAKTLTELLRDPESAGRKEALTALTNLKLPNDQYIPVLISLLNDRDTAVMSSARNLLRFHGAQSLSAIMTALPKAEREERLAMIAYLPMLGAEAQRVAPALRELLKSPDDRTKIEAASALRNFAVDAKELIPAIAAAAGSKDSIARERALQLVQTLRPRLPEFEPIYRAALKDPLSHVRAFAIESLWEIKRESLRDNMPILVELLKGGNAERSAAFTILRRVGADAKEVLPVIVEILDNADEHSVEGANLVPLLMHFGADAGAPLAKLLKHANPHIRAQAAASIWQVGASALPHLIPLMRDSDVAVRRATYQAASVFGPAAEKAVPQLIEGLKDADALVRQYAVTSLLNVGSAGKEAVPGLIAILQDDTQGDHNRSRAAQALGRIGPDAKDAVPKLRELLTTQQPHTRIRSAEALWLIAGDRKETLPVMMDYLKTNREAIHLQPNPIIVSLIDIGVPAAEVIDALKSWGDKEVHLRRLVLSAITRYYPNAKEAAPALRTFLTDQDAVNRKLAALALSVFGDAGKDAVPHLIESLPPKSRGAYYDPNVLTALAQLGPTAKDALPTLREAWKNPSAVNAKAQIAETIIHIDAKNGDEQLQWLRDSIKNSPMTGIRYEALAALARVDPKNPELRLLLAKQAASPARTIAAPAIQLLGQLGSLAKESASVLREIIKSSDSFLRQRAADALWRIEGKTEEVIPVLIALLSERSVGSTVIAGMVQERYTVAQQAAKSLGEIGPPAKAALPELRKTLGEPDSTLRQNAIDAIRKIEKSR